VQRGFRLLFKELDVEKRPIAESLIWKMELTGPNSKHYLRPSKDSCRVAFILRWLILLSLISSSDDAPEQEENLASLSQVHEYKALAIFPTLSQVNKQYFSVTATCLSGLIPA
jgi:hypothetical protein